MRFRCVQNPQIEHTAVIDVSQYPNHWRVIRSDVLDNPLLRDFDPCAKLLTDGYYEDPEHHKYFSFYEIFYEWLCKSDEPLPSKGIVWLLERMFNDTTHESWDLRLASIRDDDHFRLASRVIGKHHQSEMRFRLLVERNNLSINNAFIKACLLKNPSLTCRFAYRQLMRFCPHPSDMPSPHGHHNAYLEALMQPPGHGKLLRFFETRNHQKILEQFIGSSMWYEREKALQYSKLALLLLESAEVQRGMAKLKPFSPRHAKRALQIIRTLYHILWQRYESEQTARRELASVLMVSVQSLPPLPR